MVIACSNETSRTDNKEKVRIKRKGIHQDAKTIWMNGGASSMSSISKVSHGNLSIYNHREDAEEPAEDPNPQFHWISSLRIF